MTGKNGEDAAVLDDAHGQSCSEPSRQPVGSRPAPKRRRWPWLLGFFLLLLLVLVGSAPYIVSAGVVSRYAVSIFSDRLVGTIQLEDLSLSWFGPSEVRGVTVLDPAQREVLKVSQITYVGGAWRLLTAGEAFGEISIGSPQVVLYVTADNEVTLAQAFRLRQPAPPRPQPEPLPEPRGTVIIRSGAVRVIRGHGQEYKVSDVNGHVDLQTLGDIAGKIELTLANGGKLMTEAAIRELVSKGGFHPRGATGTLRVHTDGDVDIGPLADFVAPQSGLDATAGLLVDARVEAGELWADFNTNVLGLQTTQGAAAHASPIDFSLEGQANWKREKLTAHADFVGDAGNAHADITYHLSDRRAAVSLDEILSAVFAGESIALPDFTLEAQASVDLAALERAVPGLLKVRHGQEISAGRLEVSKLSAQGGTKPAASGSIELRDVAAKSDGRAVRLEPISLGFDASLETGKGLEIRRAEVKSGFAQVVASGAVSDLRADFRGDLTNLHRELGQVFELGSFELAGDLAGTLELSRTNDERIDVALQLTADGVRYAAGNRRLDLPHASFSHAGYLALAGQKVNRLVASEARADLNGEVVVTGSGWYDLPQQAFRADIDLNRAELAFVSDRAAALGIDELSRYSGMLLLQASVERTAREQPIRSDGTIVTRTLSVDGQALWESDATFRWSDAQVAADARRIRVETAQLESVPAALIARDVRWQAGEHLILDGRVEGAADLARCLRAIGRLARWEEPPAVAGRLSWNTTLTSAGNTLALVGTGAIDQFELGTGERALREQQLRLEYDAEVDRQKERITLAKCNIVSKPFSAEVAGAIEQYSADCMLSLSGHYDASWEHITTLLHEFVPATAKTIVVTGNSTSQFQVTGPARRPEMHPAFGGMSVGLDAGWASAEVYGVSMGPAKFSPALSDGQIRLPITTIPTSHGQVRLGGVIDLQPAEPALTLAGTTQVLENLAITPELGESLLSRINPIFLHLVRTQGWVSLRVQDVTLPLGKAIETRSAGQGHLDLANMKVQPGGLLADLLALGGLPDSSVYAVAVSGLDFVLRDGRISYDDFTLTFPGDFDLKFYGSVGFDDTLDLVVSVPISPQLLEKVGVHGSAAEYARLLAGVRVDIPIVGTREKPKLDFSRVDISALINQAVQKSSEKALQDIARDLLGGGQDRSDERKRKR